MRKRILTHLRKNRLHASNKGYRYHPLLIEVFKKVNTIIKKGEYEVLPSRPVPEHIERPNYMNEKNPTFGIYNGKARVHDKETVEKLALSGKLASETAELVLESEGMTTEDIDGIVHNFIISKNAYPTPIGFMGFPKSVCTSVNDVCCHGIPDLRKLQNGDYLNIDITLFQNGVHGDNSVMVEIGEVLPEIKKLVKTINNLFRLKQHNKLCMNRSKYVKLVENLAKLAMFASKIIRLF